jgi:peptidoglycan hydrolase-like protein with peptidoglycan-binding domain
VEQWFQNTRGLVIIVLAVVTCAVLLAIEPGDGFPSATSVNSGTTADGSLPPVTTPATTTVTTRPGATTTTVPARPTLQIGTADTANTTVLQQRLAALGYNVTADGSFGPGTQTAVKQFQTDKKISPADGVVNQATWDALLAAPGASATTTTTTKPK